MREFVCDVGDSSYHLTGACNLIALLIKVPLCQFLLSLFGSWSDYPEWPSNCKESEFVSAKFVPPVNCRFKVQFPNLIAANCPFGRPSCFVFCVSLVAVVQQQIRHNELPLALDWLVGWRWCSVLVPEAAYVG